MRTSIYGLNGHLLHIYISSTGILEIAPYVSYSKRKDVAGGRGLYYKKERARARFIEEGNRAPVSEKSMHQCSPTRATSKSTRTSEGERERERRKEREPALQEQRILERLRYREHMQSAVKAQRRARPFILAAPCERVHGADAECM